jgi:hypothetical protein
MNIGVLKGKVSLNSMHKNFYLLVFVFNSHCKIKSARRGIVFLFYSYSILKRITVEYDFLSKGRICIASSDKIVYYYTGRFIHTDYSFAKFIFYSIYKNKLLFKPITDYFLYVRQFCSVLSEDTSYKYT